MQNPNSASTTITMNADVSITVVFVQDNEGENEGEGEGGGGTTVSGGCHGGMHCVAIGDMIVVLLVIIVMMIGHGWTRTGLILRAQGSMYYTLGLFY